MPRLTGHGLQREGRAHNENGRYVGGYYSGALVDGEGTNDGYGLCACGAMSPLLDSTGARKRWHVAHKAEVAGFDAATADVNAVLNAVGPPPKPAEHDKEQPR